MKYVSAEKIKTEIDKIIDGLKRSCNPDPLGTTVECMVAAEIEALELVKSTIDGMKQEEPTPLGIKEESKRKDPRECVNNINEKAHKLGIHYSPYITYAVARNEQSGRWLASISIGEMYYETDPYKDKDGAVSELLGCLEALKENTEEKINKLNDILYGRENS